VNGKFYISLAGREKGGEERKNIIQPEEGRGIFEKLKKLKSSEKKKRRDPESFERSKRSRTQRELGKD